jgi:hypothetical protein
MSSIMSRSGPERIQACRQELEALRDRTHPRQLRQTLYHAIEQLFALPKATLGKPKNVYDTLSTRKKP